MKKAKETIAKRVASSVLIGIVLTGTARCGYTIRISGAIPVSLRSYDVFVALTYTDVLG